MTLQPTRHLRYLLRDDETLRWWAKPSIGPILVRSFLLFGTLFLFLGFWLWAPALFGGFDPLGWSRPMYAAVSVWAIVALTAFPAIMVYTHAEYAATDERLIQFGGIVGRDVSWLAWDNVVDVEVDVDPLDAVFGAGTVYANAAGVAPPDTVRVALLTKGGTDERRPAGVQFDFVEDPYAALQTLEGFHVGDGPTEADERPASDTSA